MGVKVCRGYLAKLIAKVSESLAPTYAGLFERLPGEAVLNVDETGHKENGRRFWTWCFRAGSYTLFRIDKSPRFGSPRRGVGHGVQRRARLRLLHAYRKYMRECDVLVQFCMAHLIRDVKFLLTLPGHADRVYGQRVRDALRELFAGDPPPRGDDASGFSEGFGSSAGGCTRRGNDECPGHEACLQPRQTLPRARGGVFPVHHHAGHRADQQLGGTSDAFRGDRSADHPGNAERERPPVVREDLDGDCHLHWTGRSAFQFLLDAINAHLAGTAPPSLLPSGP